MWKICQAPGLKTKVTNPENKRLPRQNDQRKLACFHPEFGILKIGRKIEKRPPKRVAFLRPLAAERRRGARIFVFLQRRKQVCQSTAPLRAPWALATTNATFPTTMLHWRPRMLHSQPGMPHSRPRMPHSQPDANCPVFNHEAIRPLAREVPKERRYLSNYTKQGGSRT